MHRILPTTVSLVSALCAACVQTHETDLTATAGSAAFAVTDPACGNGHLDPDEQCDVGARGPGSPKRWTSDDCTSDCKARIYVSWLTPIANDCAAPLKPALFACTLSCTTDDDCPALPHPYKQPRCNLIHMHTCDQPCEDESDCLPGSQLSCFQLPTEKAKVCTNAF